MAVEALTRGIINKIMHTPITTLKSAAKESEATTVIELVRRIFNLREVKHHGIPEQNETTESRRSAAVGVGIANNKPDGSSDPQD